MTTTFDNLDDTRPTITVLVDGDIVAYKCAAAADGRYWSHPEVVLTLRPDGSNVFKYKKDLVAECEKRGLDVSLCKEEYIPDPEPYALHSVKLSIERIKEDVEKEFPGYKADLKIFLTGKENFRNKINPSYKSNREGMRRPFHLSACKEYLTTVHGAIVEEGFEADDLIGINAQEMFDHPTTGQLPVIATIDKDLQMIPGYHYHLDKQTTTLVTATQAELTFYKQVLTGDVTDGIVSLKGVGPKTAEKQMALVGEVYESRYEAALALFFKYIEREEDESVEDYIQRVECIFENVANLIWIRRSREEFWRNPYEL